MAVVISSVRVGLEQTAQDAIEKARKTLKIAPDRIKKAYVTKLSVDARKQNQICFVYSIGFELDGNEEVLVEQINRPDTIFRAIKPLKFDASRSHKVRPVVVGFGPAGMFSALILARNGYRPIVLERGAAMEERIKAVEDFWNNGAFQEETNVQFGEGGAGTFSDGKLTTRINDDRCGFVLQELVNHGAPEEILYKAKPHIGTDLLRKVVCSIREEILELGGEIHFRTKLEDLLIRDGKICGVIAGGGEIPTDCVLLAIGHSARDTFEMLLQKGVVLQPKAFSVGVRTEHLQSDINRGLYGPLWNDNRLPAGEYQLSYREGERGVYTFCMCPGGFVVASSSESETVVTNGMSLYARDGKNANSAVVVSVDSSDFGAHPLAGMYFQRQLEQRAYLAGGKKYCAPAQTLNAFLQSKGGLQLGRVQPTFPNGIAEANFSELFPEQVVRMLQTGFQRFGKKIKGFDAGDTVLTAPETRTSSPVRILRGDNLQAVGIEGLYPCAEGAGYAGGIMSAAVDGIRVAQMIMQESKLL